MQLEEEGHSIVKWKMIMNQVEELKDYHEKEKEFLLKRIKNNSCILDVGCGYGRNIDYLYINAEEIVGVDFDKDAINSCRDCKKYKNCVFINKDFKKVGLNDEQFDYAICTGSVFSNMEHEDRLAVLNKIFRLLKNDGILFLSIWNDTEKSLAIKKDFLESNEINIKKIRGSRLTLNDGFTEHFSKQYLENLFKESLFNFFNIKELTDCFYIAELKK